MNSQSGVWPQHLLESNRSLAMAAGIFSLCFGIRLVLLYVTFLIYYSSVWVVLPRLNWVKFYALK